MRNNRKAALFLTDDRIPVYEGDIVKVCTSQEGTAGVHWHPRSCDYKTPDKTRLRGKSKYIRLEPHEYALLESINRLTLVLQPTERIQIYQVAPEKRKPLLRIRVWGLPPRWV
jgi:hypothetical protein